MLTESSSRDKEVRLQMGRVSRVRKDEECCQKFSKKFWRNQKRGCSLAHTVFTCTHFPLYWEVMWGSPVSMPTSTAPQRSFQLVSPVDQIPCSLELQAGQQGFLPSCVMVKGSLLWRWEGQSLGGLVAGKGSEGNMSLCHSFGGTVLEAHWPGIAGAYSSAGWEVAGEAHEAEELFRVWSGLLLHRSYPRQTIVGFKVSLVFQSTLWDAQLLLTRCAGWAARDPLSPTKHSPTSPQTVAIRDWLRGMEVVAELSQQPALLGQLSPLACPQEGLGQGPGGILLQCSREGFSSRQRSMHWAVTCSFHICPWDEGPRFLVDVPREAGSRSGAYREVGQRKKWSPMGSSPDASWGLLRLPSARTRKSAKQPFRWKY